MLLPTVLALAAFEDMLNKALDLDPATRLQLNQQLNKSILVNVQFPHISILVFLDEGKVRLTTCRRPFKPRGYRHHHRQ
jgi:ubiquinone biosynthesis protein UbiJ